MRLARLQELHGVVAVGVAAEVVASTPGNATGSNVAFFTPRKTLPPTVVLAPPISAHSIVRVACASGRGGA
jgi:hypothetical protein